MFLRSVSSRVMGKIKSPSHYIQAWRKFRKLSLRRLAARMEATPGEEMISYASLSRIEAHKQPYSEPVLNALAEALDVEPWMLLKVDPEKNGAVIDLLIHLPPEKQTQAIKLIEVLKAG